MPSSVVAILLERRRLLTVGIPVISGGFMATWAGQDAAYQAGGNHTDGLVKVTISGIAAGRTITSAVLSDDAGDTWTYDSANPNPTTFEDFLTKQDASTYYFAPRRDETGSIMTMIAVFDDGTRHSAQFAGGGADPGRTVPDISPGIDTTPIALSTLSNDTITGMVDDTTTGSGHYGQYGTFYLGNGTYFLDHPLVLTRPVKIVAEPGTQPRLVFEDDGKYGKTWRYAVDIQADHVTLQGFDIGFSEADTKSAIPWDYSDIADGSSKGTQTGVIYVDQNSYQPDPNHPLTPHIALSPTIVDMIIVGPTQYGQGYPSEQVQDFRNELYDGTNQDDYLNPGWVANNPGEQQEWEFANTARPNRYIYRQNDTLGGPSVNVSRKLLANGTLADGTHLDQTSNDQVIAAQVSLSQSFQNDLTSNPGDDDRVGIGLNTATDAGASGFNLVFHNAGGVLKLEFLWDLQGWYDSAAADATNWSPTTSYDLRFEMEKDAATQTVYLFGKAWPAGGTEPSNWTITYNSNMASTTSTRWWIANPGVASLDSGIDQTASGTFTGIDGGAIAVQAGHENSLYLIDAANSDVSGTAYNASFGVIGAKILDNVLTGGPIAIRGGPSEVVGNTINGAAADTYNSTAIYLDYTNKDVTIEGNDISQSDPTGRTVKFIDQAGHNGGNGTTYDEVVTGNYVHGGVGRMVGVNFKPSGSDTNTYGTDPIIHGGDDDGTGDILSNPGPEYIDQQDNESDFQNTLDWVSGNAAVITGATGGIFPGWILSIVSGNYFGQYYRVLQTFSVGSSLELFLDRPLPAESDPSNGYDAVVSPSYYGEVFSGNKLDLTGMVSSAFDILSNNAGLRVTGNLVIGDVSYQRNFSNRPQQSQAFNVTGGYSGSAPCFGTIISDNTFVDIASSFIGSDNNSSEVNGGTYSTSTLAHNTWIYYGTYFNAVAALPPSVTASFPWVLAPFSTSTGGSSTDAQILVTHGNTVTLNNTSPGQTEPNPVFGTGAVNSTVVTSTVTDHDVNFATSAFTGTNVIFDGQDGSDLVGPGTNNLPSPPKGIQDLHFTITGLTSTVSEILVKPDGGGQNAVYLENYGSPPPGTLSYDNLNGAAGALFIHAAGANTAELYIPPIRQDSGYSSNYEVKIWLDGQTQTGGYPALDLDIKGIFSDQYLPDPPIQHAVGVPLDYDGDKKADFSVYSPGTSGATSSTFTDFSSVTSSSEGSATSLGSAGTIPVAGDFFGDGLTDYAVYVPGGNKNSSYFVAEDPATGQVKTSRAGLYFNPGDIPVPADYLGEGRAQFAVYNRFNGIFVIYDPLQNLPVYFYIGNAAPGDIPIPADYDGDGVADPAVFDPATETYYVAYSGTHDLNYSTTVPTSPSPSYAFGEQGMNVVADSGFTSQGGDLPVPADYDGTGKAQFAFYRPGSTATSKTVTYTASGFYVYHATGANAGSATYFQTGNPGDTPIAADYDGDGKADFAVYRQGYTNSQDTTTTDPMIYWYPSASGTVIPQAVDVNMGPAASAAAEAVATAAGDTPSQVSAAGAAASAAADLEAPADTEVATNFDPNSGYADRRTDDREKLYGDLTGDYQVEYATYATGTGNYQYYNYSTSGITVAPVKNALPGDIPVPGVFVSGSAEAEAAVYRPGNATFYTSDGTPHTVPGAMPGDIPVPGDYFGLGYDQFAVYEPGNYTYYILNPSSPFVPLPVTVTNGMPGDIPVPGNYNGDKYDDFAAFNPGNGSFYVNIYLLGPTGTSQASTMNLKDWQSGDLPVPAHYLPDNETDYAVYQPAATFGVISTFYIYDSAHGKDIKISFGTAGDVPVPADYFGEPMGQGDGVPSSGTSSYGLAEVAVYRPTYVTTYASNNGIPGSNTFFVYDPRDVETTSSSKYIYETTQSPDEVAAAGLSVVSVTIGAVGDVATPTNFESDGGLGYNGAESAPATTQSPTPDVSSSQSSSSQSSPQFAPQIASQPASAPVGRAFTPTAVGTSPAPVRGRRVATADERSSDEAANLSIVEQPPEISGPKIIPTSAIVPWRQTSLTASTSQIALKAPHPLPPQFSRASSR